MCDPDQYTQLTKKAALNFRAAHYYLPGRLNTDSHALFGCFRNDAYG